MGVKSQVLVGVKILPCARMPLGSRASLMDFIAEISAGVC